MNLEFENSRLLSPMDTIWSDSDIRIISYFGGQTFADFEGIVETQSTDDLRMLFCLSGGFLLRFLKSDQICERKIAGGHCNLHLQPEGCRFECLAAEPESRGLFIAIAHERLIGLLAGDNAQPVLAGMAANRQGCRMLALSPFMRSVINQILSSGLKEGNNHLFYLAKILELLCSLTNPRHDITCTCVPGADRAVVQKAMRFLTDGLDNPPSIDDLAGRVGISASKLKLLFPKICGMTPYGYLRKVRMEKALALLTEGRMNVTEVAYDVGFNSISHFTKVFIRYHGIKPSRVRR